LIDKESPMNAQTSVRLLLPLALACGLTLAIAPATGAQSGPAPSPQLKGCGYLQVIISGTKARATNVTCGSGSFYRYVPPSGELTPDEPVLVSLYQSGARGPECVITVSGDKDTAVLQVQQNFCGLAAGEVTAKVVSGNAKLVRVTKGAYRNTPGTVLFSVGF
jgi:hypothetical protein